MQATSQRPQRWHLSLLGLAAVVAHLPALAGYFAQDDWRYLAKAAGIYAGEGQFVRPLSNIWFWQASYSLFGLEAPVYHAAALLMWGAICLLTLRVGLRLGLSGLGAWVAALVTVGTPVVVTPIFWASATGEILAALFALMAIDRWLAGGWENGVLAVAAAYLSFFSKEAGLALPVVMAMLVWTHPQLTRLDRGTIFTWGALLATAAGAAGAAWTVASAFDTTAGSPYALAGPLTTLLNFGALGGWLISPWDFAPAGTPLLPWVGLLVWTVWTVMALRHAQAGDRILLLSLVLAALSVAPVVQLERHLMPYYLTLATVGWGWALGSLVGTWLDERSRSWNRQVMAAATLASVLVVSAVAWGATRDRLTRRTLTGELANPVVARSAIAHEVKTQVDALPLEAGTTLAVLHATTVAVPDAMPMEEARRTTSKVYVAIEGALGLQMMVPDSVDVAWESHLDQLRRDALVFLDIGTPRLVFLGRTDNARFYSALIAVAAGQFERARHDLWVVSGDRGTLSNFLFDEDSLPVPVIHIDEMSPQFARYLLDDDDPESKRVLSLYQQLYEAVRGKPLRLDADD